MKKTIYIAQPTSSKLRPIRKEDPSCLKVNNQFLKIGKALDFQTRIKDYIDDQEGEVIVEAIVDLHYFTPKRIAQLETAIKRRLKPFSQYNMPGPRDNGTFRVRKGRTEWVKGISYDDVKQIILEEFEKM